MHQTHKQWTTIKKDFQLRNWMGITLKWLQFLPLPQIQIRKTHNMHGSQLFPSHIYLQQYVCSLYSSHSRAASVSTRIQQHRESELKSTDPPASWVWYTGTQDRIEAVILCCIQLCTFSTGAGAQRSSDGPASTITCAVNTRPHLWWDSSHMHACNTTKHTRNSSSLQNPAHGTNFKILTNLQILSLPS